MAGVVEACVVAQDVAREAPQTLVESIEHVEALDAHLLDDLLVEVVEQLLARVPLAYGDLVGELALELVELALDLFGGAARLVDRRDAFLEVYAGLDRAEYLVAGAEHAVEEPELLVEELVDALVGGVGTVQEVHDDDVELLPVAVAAADTLLDPLGVPGQVVVDDQVAELEVDALSGRLGGNEDRRIVAEVFDQRGPHVGTWCAADARIPIGRFRSRVQTSWEPRG